MITNLTALVRNTWDNVADTTLALPFIEDGVSPYYVRNFSGLGPVKAEASRFATPLDPGSSYLSSRDGERNIVLTVELQANAASGSTAGSLRQTLYSIFETGNIVELQFTTEELGMVMITGVVESNEPGDLSGSPVNQISIICVDPYFDDLAAQTVLNVDTLQAAWNGPVGTLNRGYFTVNYDGKVPVGFVFESTYNAALPSQGVYLRKVGLNDSTIGYIALNNPVVSGDKHSFTTVKGSRGVTYTRSGSTQTALPWFQGSLVDMKLTPGRNIFIWGNLSASAPNATFLKYKKRYGGL